jgi:hypothetical protein
MVFIDIHRPDISCFSVRFLSFLPNFKAEYLNFRHAKKGQFKSEVQQVLM